jgi:hypothetical protein
MRERLANVAAECRAMKVKMRIGDDNVPSAWFPRVKEVVK